MPRIAIRDVSLFVKVMGGGGASPMLFMHGGPGLDHTTLLPLAPLARDHALVFYDHRCNGRSGGAVETMTWENLTADADALRATLGYDRWIVLGHSFGGHVALEYVLRHPDRVSQLILMDTAADARWSMENGPRILAKRGYGAVTVRAAQRFFNGDMAPRDARVAAMRLLRAYYHHIGLRGLPGMLAGAFDLKYRPETQIFGFGQLQKGWTVMDRLHEIEVPALVIGGRDDFLFPPECEAILADRLPNARLEIIERAGHNPQQEQPAAVIDCIRDFIAETASATELAAVAHTHGSRLGVT